MTRNLGALWPARNFHPILCIVLLLLYFKKAANMVGNNKVAAEAGQEGKKGASKGATMTTARFNYQILL